MTGYYYSIVNYVFENRDVGRSIIALVISTDLLNWKKVKILYDFSNEDLFKHGVQYVDFFIENKDILYVCRTALNDPENFHNSNYTTFHKIENFRDLIPEE